MFTLPAWTTRIVGSPEPASIAATSASGVHGAVRAGRDALDRGHPEPEQPERAVDRRVALLARDHTDPGRALQTVPLHVPARALEHPVARRREPDGVPRLRPRHDPERRGPGRPSDSFNHTPTVSSTIAAAGDDAPLNAS